MTDLQKHDIKVCEEFLKALEIEATRMYREEHSMSIKNAGLKIIEEMREE